MHQYFAERCSILGEYAQSCAWLCVGRLQHIFNTVLTETTLSPTPCKSLRKIWNIKNARPKLIFFLFIQIFRRMARWVSLVFATWLVDWRLVFAKSILSATVGQNRRGVETCENLSQLECWIMNTNPTQPNKPRWMCNNPDVLLVQYVSTKYVSIDWLLSIGLSIDSCKWCGFPDFPLLE